MRAVHALLLATSTIFGMTGANAAELITNGGFETGDYSGWTVNVQDGSAGGLFVVANNGGQAPVSGFSYAANAKGGSFFSITDQGSAGSYTLTQSFTLKTAQTVSISFDMFANDFSGTPVANGRDYTVQPNQNAVADLLAGGADAFTDGAGILKTFYGPGADAGENPNPWTSYSFDVALAAGTYQLRFAETDNQLFFNQGVDNVSVRTSDMPAVPEPASWAMMIGGTGVIGGGLRRRRATTPRFA